MHECLFITAEGVSTVSYSTPYVHVCVSGEEESREKDHNYVCTLPTVLTRRDKALKLSRMAVKGVSHLNQSSTLHIGLCIAHLISLAPDHHQQLRENSHRF